MISTLSHIHDATEAARKRIDLDIERHVIAIAALKAQRNALSLISRLPPEIYSMIFLFVKNLSYAASFPTSVQLQWIKISHVSTHWRNVALNSPTLWKDPPLANTRWTVIMLERSRSANLSIRVDFTNANCPPQKALYGLNRALEHGSRINHLVIRNVDSSTQKVSDALPMCTLTSLKTLQISGRRHYDPSDTNANGIPKHFRLPSSFLKGVGRSLHQLDLAYCEAPGTWHLFRTITQLKLHDVMYTTNPTLEEFTRALSDLTHLEALDLKNTLPTPSNPPEAITSSTDDVIHFGCLKQLSISSTTRGVAGFLLRITFPPSSLVRIECGGDAAYVSAVFKGLTRSYSKPHTGIDFQTLVVERGKDVVMDDTTSFSIQFRLFAEASAVNPTHPDRYPDRLRLSFNDLWINDKTKLLEMRRINKNKTMTHFFNSGFPLGRINHVHLSDALSIDPETVMHTIGLLPALRFVGAYGHMGNVFIKALQLARIKPGIFDLNSNVGNFYFPALSSLSLAGIHFLKSRGFGWASESMDINIALSGVTNTALELNSYSS